MKYFILNLTGSLTIGEGDVLLRRQVDAALTRGYEAIIIDLTGVTYMDSAAVGQLAHCYKTITEQSGEVALVGIQPKVRKLLQVMSFLDLFQVFSTREDALQIMEMRAAGKVTEPYQVATA